MQSGDVAPEVNTEPACSMNAASLVAIICQVHIIIRDTFIVWESGRKKESKTETERYD